MPGRILLAALLTAFVLPVAGAGASEGSQARAVGDALRPFATALQDVDLAIADAVADAGDETAARCGQAADAVAGLPAARRRSVVSGLTLLQVGLDSLPGTLQVLLIPLQTTQDELQDLRLTHPALRSARASRRRAIKALVAVAGGRESVCPMLEPWAAAGFTTAPDAPSYVAIRAANRRVSQTLEAADAAFDGTADRRRAVGARILARARVGRRVQEALTLGFELPETSSAISSDPFAARLRRAARG